MRNFCVFDSLGGYPWERKDGKECKICRFPPKKNDVPKLSSSDCVGDGARSRFDDDASSSVFFFFSSSSFALLMSTQNLATTPSRKSPKSTLMTMMDGNHVQSVANNNRVGTTRTVRAYVMKLAVNHVGIFD